jgi:hypothetical protein
MGVSPGIVTIEIGIRIEYKLFDFDSDSDIDLDNVLSDVFVFHDVHNSMLDVGCSMFNVH